VATVRFDPPKRTDKKGITFSDVKRIGRAVLGGPGGILYEAVAGMADQRQGGPSTAIYNMRPVELDTVTNEVKVITSNEPGQIGAFTAAKLLNRQAELARPMLEWAYKWGKVDPKTPPAYREVAKTLAEMHWTDYGKHSGEIDYTATVEDPPSVDSVRNEDTFMGGIIPPGGLAGFSQMTGASKLALMRGTRRKGSTGRRRKKRKTAKKARKAGRPRKKAKRKLTKGSAAAKRYMASIRKKRGSYRRG